MRNYKNLVVQAQEILRSFKNEREQNRKNSPNAEWLRERNSESEAKYKAKMDANKTERSKLLLSSLSAQYEAVNKARKGQSKDKPRNIHLALEEAKTYMSGDIEASLKAFEMLMQDPDRRPYKHVFEDYLKFKAVDSPTYQVQVQQTIERHRTPEEKVEMKEYAVMQVLREHQKTIDGQLDESFRELAETGDTASMELGEIWDEMVTNAKYQTEGAQEEGHDPSMGGAENSIETAE